MLSRDQNTTQRGDCLAVKDTHLVYRACTMQFAMALGCESPRDVIGKSDFDLLSADAAQRQLTLDSQTVINAQPDVDKVSLVTGAEMVIVRTPILSPKKQVRGIDIRLIRHDQKGKTPLAAKSDADGINYQSLVDEGLQGSMILQQDRVVFANQNAARMLGFDSAQALLDRATAASLFSREDWGRLHRNPTSLHEKRAAMGPTRLTLSALNESGKSIPLMAKVQETVWQGKSAVLLSFVDLDAKAVRVASLPESERRYRHYAQASADFFWELDDQLRFSFVSEECLQALALPSDSVIGKTHKELLGSEENLNPEDHWDAQLDRLNSRQAFRDFEFRWGDDDDARTIRYSGIPIYDNDHVFLGYRGTGRDVTAANRQAESVAYHASHDALTGLINRRHFEVLCERALTASKNDRKAHALCFMDLDSFKIVNDTCGHLAGDELLRQLSALLDSLVRKSDVLARLGGDEFGLLLYNCSVPVALKLANQLRSEVENFQFLWSDKRFQVGVSVGLVQFDERWENLKSVFGAADSACYLAKNEGRNRVVVYEGDGPSSNRKVETHWVEEINAALADDRMVVARQVILPLNDQSDASRFEMFMRLRATNGDIIQPGSFLPSAERYGLSAKLDLVMIELTLNWLKTQPQLLNTVKLCSINLTSGTFANPETEAELVELIENSSVPASKLCFEMTETSTIANLSVASTFMKRLRDLGCHFMLDDFGSGLSAFTYLKELPIDYLKIDGTLTKNILNDRTDFAMVKAINEISQSLDMQTVAKYVESQEQLDAVREIGIDFVQGYHLGKPEVVDT